MHKSNAADVLGEAQVIPLVTFDSDLIAVDLANCLAEAGISLIEVAFRTPFAASAIEKISLSGTPVTVSAGTVLHPHQVLDAAKSGAKFGFSPGTDETLLRFASDNEFPMVPGVATPTESVRASGLGYTVQKFFPAEVNGGLAWLRSMASPLAGVQFVPTGGIGEQNFADYLALSNVIAVGGSWIVPEHLVKKRDFDSIHQLAKSSMAIAANP